MAYQGEYDGLCGMYAVANALVECGVEDGKEIFEVACSALAHRGWPQGIWEGTGMVQMMQMINHCRDCFYDEIDIDVKYPFWGGSEAPESNQEYVERFHELFEEHDPYCAIVGTCETDEASGHWFVVKKPDNTLRTMEIVDSYALDENRNIYTPTLEQMELDYRGLVLFVDP